MTAFLLTKTLKFIRTVRQSGLENLLFDIILQSIYGLEKINQRVVIYVALAYWTLRERKADFSSVPSLLKNQSRAVEVENMATKHLNRGRTR